MKILALGDPHGKLPKNLDSIIKKNKIEIIVCVGELFPITRNKDKKGYANLKKGEWILNQICSHKIPTIIFKGNMFLSKEGAKYFRKFLIKYRKRYKNFYYKKTGKLKIKGINFVLFDMIYEEHSHKFLSKYWTDKVKNSKRLEKLNTLLKENREAILLSHAPPYGIVDKTHNGKHIGSKILLKAIKKYQPRIVLCGHIHEAQGEGKIGKTKIYNLGCCGNYKIIEIGKN